MARDESAAVEEAWDRLDDLERKRPRLGRIIGLSCWGEASAEESELARKIDEVRGQILADYRLALGVEAAGDEEISDDV